MSKFPDSATGWVVLIAIAAGLICAEQAAIRGGWLKAEKDVSPAWAYARFRLIALAVDAGGLLVYLLLFRNN